VATVTKALAAHFVILKTIRKHHSTWKNLVEWCAGLPEDSPGKAQASTRCSEYARTVWEHVATLGELGIDKEVSAFLVEELYEISNAVGRSIGMRTADHDKLMKDLGGNT
jgi:uncharacterized protein YbdZ (MbtH family)